MATHVFIATTQGLVAVNNLYTLPGAVANSTVTAKGFSQPLPIANNYHNFVKLGSGIIEEDFGEGKFRIDLSDEITQGLSWQLGFYLAHAARHCGILGNGQPQPGDHIICATGAINTAQRRVVEVDHVPVKIEWAREQLTLWQSMCSVLFLLPQANAEEITEVEGVTFQLVEAPEEVALFLPDHAAIRPLHKSTLLPAESPEQVPAPSSRSISYWIAALVACAGIAIISGVAWQWPGSGNPAQAQSDTQHQGVVSSSADHSTPVPNASPDPALTLALETQHGETCGAAKMSKAPVSEQDNVFNEVAVNKNLCRIAVLPSEAVTALLFIGLGEQRVVLRQLPMNKPFIPLPQGKGTKRYYLAALADELNEKTLNQLKGYLFEQASPTTLTRGEVEQKLVQLMPRFSLYQHTLSGE
ncbi:hypothetical protein [Alteromonas sp. 14N.309.X.WAT.G.H12]|uniref:hypothetical protein n=1 Tax=Alteromonas sp. 14N.309.X.WAT.G.H12 TaxID=3120824 RepID=UPI002FD1C3EF